MSEAHFIRDEIAQFRKEHPSTDGWSIHRISPGAQPTFLPKLPAFLRAKLPGAFTESIASDFSYYSRKVMTKGTLRIRLTQLPYKQHGGGLHEDNWAGDLNFVWAGSPIHVRRTWIAFSLDMGPKPPLALIATKSDKALTDLFKAGIRFAKGRKNTLKSEIHLVNGQNYPRPRQTWSDLILPEDIKSQIRDGFESFLESKQRYRDLGLPYRRGFLLVGPPGNGKTLVTKVIAGSYKVPPSARRNDGRCCGG